MLMWSEVPSDTACLYSDEPREIAASAILMPLGVSSAAVSPARSADWHVFGALPAPFTSCGAEDDTRTRRAGIR